MILKKSKAFLFLLAVFFALLASSKVRADSADFVCLPGATLSPVDGSALISKVQARYSKVDRFVASVEQSSYLAALDTSESSSGRVYFEKPGKMRWDYFQPEKQVFVANGELLYFLQPESSQLMVDELSNVLLSEVPVGFIMGIGDLSRDFKYEGGCKTASGVALTLTPVLKKKSSHDDNLKSFKLLVDPTACLPKGALVVDIGGNTTAISLSGFKEETRFEPGLFKINPPEGFDIIDRRKNPQPFG